jgi:hypothetical protein
MINAPKNSIILLEDIDGIFVQRGTGSVSSDGQGKKRSYVTFTGLLNAMDGVRS